LILSTVVSISVNQRKNIPIDEQEMKVLREKNDQTLEDSHFDNDRGKLIGFHQGADDRKSKNRALLDFEKCNHKTYAEAVCCIKVSLN
jgi:hypothetical protein